MTDGLDIERVAVSNLHLDPANVRRHPERNLAAIKASLARFGQQKPIVVDANNVVRAGNGTLQAAIELGWADVAIVATTLAGSEATAFSVADNRSAELASWDEQALAETLRSLQSEDFDLAAVGYTEDEVDALIESLGDEMLDESPPEQSPVIGRYGVIVECVGEAHQREVYERLMADGLTCRVVCV